MYVLYVFLFTFSSLVSGSNLASHMVGSLKKGSKQSMSLPSTAYNTLPAHVHQMRSTTSSPRVISGQNISSGNSGGTGHGPSHGKKPYLMSFREHKTVRDSSIA